MATVKAGTLLAATGGGKTASGLALPHITLTARMATSTATCRPTATAYDGVRAYFYDANVNSAKKQEAIAGAKGDNLKDHRHTWKRPPERPARRPRRVEPPARGSATLRYVLARGQVDLIPERP
ncbi:hypothetical protein ACRFBT_26520 [Pseudomonas aeruginosa]|uniref:hypothetical protein n=1 Tax=Pseudomonas aeruginosa TaxID=287 RepID=UPI003D6F7E44